MYQSAKCLLVAQFVETSTTKSSTCRPRLFFVLFCFGGFFFLVAFFCGLGFFWFLFRDTMVLKWLPCKVPSIVGSAPGLIGPVSVYR